MAKAHSPSIPSHDAWSSSATSPRSKASTKGNTTMGKATRRSREVRAGPLQMYAARMAARTPSCAAVHAHADHGQDDAPPPEGRAHQQHEHGAHQVEEELRAHEPRGRVPGQVRMEVPRLHHQEIAQKAEDGLPLARRHVEKGETGLPRRGDASIQ